MKKRGISILLTICLVLSAILVLVPIAAAAAMPDGEITNFPLNAEGTVLANWNQAEEKLSITGTGKIERDRWDEVKGKFGGEWSWGKATTTFEFVDSGIKFPDDAGSMFRFYKGKILFHPQMDTSNVTNMRWMFMGTQVANPDVSGWNTSLENSYKYRNYYYFALNTNCYPTSYTSGSIFCLKYIL